jgi:FG-GAP-like repeat/Abnormal spindle-like microcephaly-assoc'd, ASPM-SPD-2-Hydin
MRRIGLPLLTLIACLVAAAPASAVIPFTPSTVNLSGGTTPHGIASDGFAGPGSSDLVTANQGSSNVSLLLGNGGGGFSNASGSPFAGPTGAQDVATGDFNNDGIPDVVAVGNGQLNVRLGNGSGGLSGATTINDGAAYGVVVTADFNSDGNLDFAGLLGITSQVNVYLGNGSGTTFTLAPSSPIAVGTSPVGLATDDFNNDGKPDLVVANTGASAAIQVFLGTGSAGAFDPQTAVSLPGTSPSAVATGDVNNDGNADAAVSNANAGGSGVLVLLGNGAGGFSNSASPATVNAGPIPEDVVAGDIDGDGLDDLAVANDVTSGTVTVLLNNGSGTSYTNNGALPAGNSPFSVTTFDTNVDGNTDLAVTNSGDSTVTVFVQTQPTASVNPTSLAFGNQVINTQSATKTVTLTNNGPQTIGPLASITGPNKDDFVRINDRCTPSSIFVPPGGTCTIGVAFKPKSLGDKNATLQIASNAANSPQTVSLSGTGVSPAPVSQQAPAISGNAVRGDTLTCSNGTWTNNPTSFAHQWLRNGQPIPGATNQTYTVAEADVGQPLTCHVTASNAGGSNSRTSSAVTPTAPAPTLTVAVPRQSLNAVLSKGLTFRAICVDACRVTGQVTGPVPPKKKRKARGSRVAVVGRTNASLAGGTVRTLRVRISRAGKKALRGKRSATLRLAVSATDPAGSPRSTKTTSVKLKRKAAKRKR